jgi:glycosyltransferase involved in cell wall biosynthesis
MLSSLESRLNSSLHSNFNIGRPITKFDKEKIRLYWTHNLPNQRTPPEVNENQILSRDDRWNYLDNIIFVSKFQKNEYIKRYKFDESEIRERLKVIRNAIEPIYTKNDKINKYDGNKIKLIYTSVPERGLRILYEAFNKLYKKYNIDLDVFSSYVIYGFPEGDIVHRSTLDLVKKHANINYHGTASNSEVRNALKRAHIFAYPSTYIETSCISLIEAMSAGCLCIHPDIGALSETSNGYTDMFERNGNVVEQFTNELEKGIIKYLNTGIDTRKQIEYIEQNYSWDIRIKEWESYLNNLLRMKNES